jgi:glycosyltransferase involved in cell wall biosynthesis
MAGTLRLLRVPFIVLVHDADDHPGDGLPMQMRLQQALCRRAAAIGVLSTHVGERLKTQGLAGTPSRPLICLYLPPIDFAMPPTRPRPDGGMRLLMFGRLLPYKGLDLLNEALVLLGPKPGLEVRVVGSGPESPALDELRALPNVAVEKRWVPEDEVGTLLAWSDALVLPYREASQSGIAAAALAAGRRVLATNVGGLAEQLALQPLALLCEPDARSLAAGLQRLFDASQEQSDRPIMDSSVAWQEMAAKMFHQIQALKLCASGSTKPMPTQPKLE